jgi:hypothetical protein
MSYYTAEASKVIEASQEEVYAIISDYHEGHPAILPTRYFKELTVTEGGQGEGTTMTVRMNVFGAKALFELTVTKAVPGRLLVEEDKSAGVVTTFTLEPLNGTGQTRVTIATTAKTSSGLKGMMEKRINPAIMRKIYREELEQLAQVILEENGT